MSTALLDVDTLDLIRREPGPVLLGLSGGGDSTALLHLLVEALGADRVRACVVDHALRPDSKNEAQRAASFAKELVVEAEMATLMWEPPGARMQEETRRARYQALCDSARKLGARTIALAHTRDDQAETVFLRAASGSGWRGLAGMRAVAPAPIWPEGRALLVVRPLLRARREELRTYLRDRRASWIEDPSNENVAFARVRARKRLAAFAQEGFDAMRLAELAEQLSAVVEVVDDHARTLIADSARFEDDAVRIDPKTWPPSTEASRRALAVLIAAAAGEERGASASQVAALETQMLQPDFTGVTLGGAYVRRRRAELLVERDKGAVLGRAGGPEPLAPLPLPKNEQIVWDGRLAVTALETGWSIVSDARASPQLSSAAKTLPLAEAQTLGIVHAEWLLREHAAHLLAGYERLKSPVFTG